MKLGSKPTIDRQPNRLVQPLYYFENRTRNIHFSSPGKKTIVSMDMQLYAYCIQLQSDNEIRDQFVFRTGELHVVFVMLRSIENTSILAEWTKFPLSQKSMGQQQWNR